MSGLLGWVGLLGCTVIWSNVVCTYAAVLFSLFLCLYAHDVCGCENVLYMCVPCTKPQLHTQDVYPKRLEVMYNKENMLNPCFVVEGKRLD